MPDETSGVYAGGAEEVVEGLRREFFDEAAESLRDLDVSLDAARHGHKPAHDLIAEVHRVAIPLYGQANTYGARLIGTVARRMEDYLAHVGELTARTFEDLQVFVDTLVDLVEGRTPLDADPAEAVRRLPAKRGLDMEDIEVRDVEVMLVMLHGTATRFVEREMQQCGYRITTVTSTFEALPVIVRTKPDMVIISAVMPDLGGIDMAIALAAMPATRNIPMALITSLDADDEYLKLLPDSVPVIHKSPTFGDDLAEALSRLFMI